MNTRAITEQGMWTIIFGIIVALVIIPVMMLFGRVFGPGGEAGTATAGLDSLHVRILEVYSDRMPFAVARNHPLFLQAGEFAMVAFNADDDSVQSGCEDETARRPALCLKDRACLCLYEDGGGDDFDDDIIGPEDPIECRMLPPDIVFVGAGDRLEEGGDSAKKWNMGVSIGAPSVKTLGIKEHENLLLYGECGDMVWNKQNVYIEKYPREGFSQFFVARESSHTQQRFETFSKQFPVPESMK